MRPPALFFILTIALTIHSPLWAHKHFRVICSSSVKISIGILMGIAFNIQIALGTVDILTIFFQSVSTVYHSIYLRSSVSFISVV